MGTLAMKFGVSLLLLAFFAHTAASHGHNAKCSEIKAAYRGSKCCNATDKATTYMVSPSLDMTNIVETPLEYTDSSGELTGRLVYKQGGTNMPGLVLYGGPWGDGGGAAEREYAKVYAAKGMVVFLPDYFPEVCGDTNQTTLSVCLGKYFGGFLLDTPYAQRLALLAYTTLKNHALSDSNNIGAMGFCFGGAMTLQAARAGAPFKVAVSLHGEYPDQNTTKYPNTQPWATKYFVEMVG